MIIDELKKYEKLSVKEQYEKCLSLVPEKDLMQIRYYVNNTIDNNYGFLNLNERQLEVFFLEFYDKISALHGNKQKTIFEISKNVNEIHENIVPYQTNKKSNESIEKLFLENYRKNNKSDGTQVFNHFKKFVIYCQSKNIKPESAEQNILEKYYNELSANGKNLQSLRVIFTNIKVVYKFLADNKIGGYSYNPIDLFDFSKMEAQIKCENKIPSREETLKIIEALNEKYQAVLAIMVVHGYSHNDMKNLYFYNFYDSNNKKHVDFIYCEDKDLKNFSISQAETDIILKCADENSWYSEIISEIFSEDKIEKCPFEDFNRRDFEYVLLKTVKKLHSENIIKEEYSAKAFKILGIKNIFEKSEKNLQFVQKVLHHSSPSATKLFLKTNGLIE